MKNASLFKIRLEIFILLICLSTAEFSVPFCHIIDTYKQFEQKASEKKYLFTEEICISLQLINQLINYGMEIQKIITNKLGMLFAAPSFMLFTNYRYRHFYRFYFL
uniref:Uncharacterized protein n=1 Tax=Trichobilharzia regenti TaxID=157069 RepID=A0AA85JDA9_TRIRE|nr:unnamed protein product [Trichobilharzia regenti]